MKLIHFINRKLPHPSETKEDFYILNVIVTSILENNDEEIIFVAHKQGQTTTEKFLINKLYYTPIVRNIIEEAISTKNPIKVGCVQYRYIRGVFSKRYGVWKVIQISDGLLSRDWIQLDYHSKIF